MRKITQIVWVLSKWYDHSIDSMFVFFNRCACAELHQQKRARKLCSATLKKVKKQIHACTLEIHVLVYCELWFTELYNIKFVAKWYQFSNWAEPSIKQVSKVANRKYQNTTAVSFFFLFFAPSLLAARLLISCSSNFWRSRKRKH